jgi:S1-C subfamily serine protease
MTAPKRPTQLLAAVVLAACVGLVGGAGSAWALYQRLGPAERIVSAPAAPGSNGAPGQSSQTYASLAAAAAPSIVRIVTRSATARDLVDGGVSGLATGFVATSDGAVLTSAHAVQGATLLEVAFADGTLAQATVAAKDTVHGLVLLRPRLVQGASFPPGLAFANFDSSAPRPGDLAIAVGMRVLSGLSVTVGTVSAVGRPLPAPSAGESPVLGALTVDAIADPADDGAPLLDATGKVIGVVVDVAGGGPAGVLALDGRSAASLVASAGGSARTGPTLGLNAAQLDAADAAAVHARPGALVVSVDPGGPAGLAGVRVGDVVTAVNGTAVTADRPLDPVRLGLATGQHVRLTVLRAGQEQDVDLTVG